jgi:alpha,alpha-trehalase
MMPSFRPVFLLCCIAMLGLSACRSESDKAPAAAPERSSPDELFGDLFHAVQMDRVFPDGKTFVDCTPRFPADTIMARYAAAKAVAGFDLRAFVLEHFELPKAYASGFVSDPGRSAAEHIDALWEVLTRRPDDAAQAGSLIPLPHPYIVPGGRFGEVYYWDSYFTLLGLQAAGRADIVRNMVSNFAYLIDTVGFIPNGNRTYYLGRSQPPFFSMMVRVLEEMDGADAALRYLPQLEREHAFWMEGKAGLSQENPEHRRVLRMPDGSVLNRYWDDRHKPRPESYREDLETSQNSPREDQAVFLDLRAGAESGWDFSSRWLSDPMDLATIRTTAIVPVDLNALLYHLETMIEAYARRAGKTEQADRYARLAAERKAALQRYCWDAEAGFFMDYDFENERPTGVLSLAGAYPLFFKIADDTQATLVAQVIERDFLKAGGVVTTLTNTGQQWDAPNGWAPLQWITIQGLRHYNHTRLADEVRNRWVALNEKVYRNTGKMVEKYNVLDMTLEAGGGEYPVQDGFGWTNGVLLRLLSETGSGKGKE